MNIRRARVDDAPGIARLQIESYRTAYKSLLPQSYLDHFTQEEQEEDWRKVVLSNPEEILYVAASNAGDIIGFALGRVGSAGISSYDSELISMHVQANQQHKGVGRALIAALARELLHRRCGSLMLWVLQGNPAQGFYERLGGRAVGTQTSRLGEDVTIGETAYGWKDIKALMGNTLEIYL